MWQAVHNLSIAYPFEYWACLVVVLLIVCKGWYYLGSMYLAKTPLAETTLPADDYAEKRLNVNDLVVPHPISTYFIKVSDDSMIGASIYPDDIIVVDRAITATHNRIVVARLGQNFTIMRLLIITGGKRIILKPENAKYAAIEVTYRSDFEIWGVVTWILHKTNSTR
jgi:DNA polymerase V